MELLKGLFSKYIGDLLESKKVRTFIVGALAGLAAKMGLPEAIAADVSLAIWGMATTVIIGFASQDFGKARHKMEIEAR